MESWEWDAPGIFAGHIQSILAIFIPATCTEHPRHFHPCHLRCYEQVNDGSGGTVLVSSSGVKFD